MHDKYRASACSASLSFFMCVRKRLAFAANRKLPGVEALHSLSALDRWQLIEAVIDFNCIEIL